MLANSETGGSEEEEQELAAGVLRALELGIGEPEGRPRVGVIVLYNCSVSVLENDAARQWLTWSDPKEFIRSTTGGVKGWGF